MSDQYHVPRSPEPPADLPPEYAETYRRAYEAAYRDLQADTPTQVDLPPVPAPDRAGTEPTVPVTGDDEQRERYAVSGPLFADEPPAPAAAEPTQVLSGLALLEHARDRDDADPEEAPARPAWLVPALLALAAVVLLAAAFLVGKLVSGGVAGADHGAQPVDVGGNGPLARHQAQGAPYDGALQAIAVGSASASCQSADAVDAAGHKVSYPPKNVYDGDLTTAWRCNGDGVGQKLTLQLPPGSKVAQVGLVPGYAKTDPANGADRYAENNRITKVRWVFDDGTTVTQTFDGSPKRRDLQTKRIPVTAAGSVTVEVLSSTPGPRHTIAVSEVELAGPAG